VSQALDGSGWYSRLVAHALSCKLRSAIVR
jgi:hypothetical protein